ncbi:dihydrolipoyllysine-residue acetyltransferase [Psychrosphaera haliotis]|nr:dihydrolipoyllysine-residue acetyltransferase [Psychrosphaera haliotis]
MSTDFILPDIGEGIVECEVVEWLVAEGDTVKEDQPICEVMTDKAMVEIPAKSDGVIAKLYYQKGEIAKVHGPLFAIEESGGDVKSESSTEAASNSTSVNPVQNQKLDNSNSSGTILEDFLLPDIGEGIVECEVVEWLVAEGDAVKEDQPICEVMTDKAMVEIPAKSDGTVAKLYYQKGEIAIVHQPLFAIAVAGNGPAQAESLTQQVKAEKAVTNNTQNVSSSAQVDSNKILPNGKKAVASPAVRRLAREMNLDITMVQGTGAKGRVYKQDLLNHSATQQASATPASSLNAGAVEKVTQPLTRVEPIRGVKSAMAKAMQDSVSTIPHFTYSDEIDLTALYALRKQLKPEYEAQGIKLTMMPFFMKAMSLAMKQFPIINSKPNADCTELTYYSEHNIGMAVDSKVGLLVPNIKGCESLSIKEIAVKMTEVTEQARAGRLSPEQLKGGTISISNIGALGGTTATPIINKPEVAIVALGKMQLLPRFNDQGEVEARRMMNVSWSGDHRIIDGGTIARFNNLWTKYLENPSSMIMDMV